MKTIFVVDDSEANRVSAKVALESHYITYAIPNAVKMFKLINKIIPDLILLDVDMPDLNGFDVMKLLKTDSRYSQIPVIMLTAKRETEIELKGFELGVIDFIGKPFSPPILLKRIETHLETDLLIKKSLKAVHDIHYATISVIANLVETRDEVTGGHIERTQEYLSILLDEILRQGLYKDEISSWDMSLLLPSAQLHDVGKIAVSDTILNKPGKLTDEEFEKMKEHCIVGETIIDEIISKTKKDDFLVHAKRFAGSHHEKWNGKGYPRGLSGENIPLEGRIMAIADVYDALVSVRPYKKPFSHSAAVAIIKKDAGTHFDPNIVKAFLNVENEFHQERIKLQGGQ